MKLNESLRLQTPIDFANYRKEATTIPSTTHKNQPPSSAGSTAIDFFLKQSSTGASVASKLA